MIKKIVSILLMVIFSMLVIMAAKEYNKIREKNDSEKITETGTKDEIMLWYSFEEYGEYLQYVADMYKNVKGVNVTIKYVGATSEGDMIDAIAAANSTGEELPDMYITSSRNLEELYLLGLCKENTNSKYNEKNYSAAAMDAITYKDKYYAYPMAFEMCAFVYNKNYVTEYPRTFDAIKTYADNFNKLSEENKDSDVDFSLVEDIIVWDTKNVKANYGFIGEYVGFSGTYAEKDEKVSVDTEKFTQSMAYYKEFYDYFSLKNKATGTEEENYKKIVSDFAAGKIVFTILNIKSLKELDDLGVSYGVCPLPMLSSSLATKPLAETDIVVVNPYADDLEQAEEFAKYLTFEATYKMYEMTGMLPTKNIKKYENEGLKEIATEYANSASLPKNRRLSDYWLKVENLFKTVNNIVTETNDSATGVEDGFEGNTGAPVEIPESIKNAVNQFVEGL